MIVTLEIFKAAVIALQNNTLEDIFNSLDSVRNHQEAMENQYSHLKATLGKTIIYYKKYESQMDWRKKSINDTELMTWVPLLTKHKQANVFPEVKKETINKIVKARKEIDRIDLSLSEFKLRLKEIAKQAKQNRDEIRKAKTQVFVLETAVDVSIFLKSRTYDPKEIADYEIEKYYDLFRRGGNDIG